MNTSRRVFLKSGALALASVGLMPGLGPDFLRGTAFAADNQRNARRAGGKKVLVCIFLRGAVDGLSVVVPHGDADYYKLRQLNNNGIALANSGENGVIDLDGTFGLNPALAALKPIYDAGHLAPIQAVGSPNATRSHFDAQDYMESAVPGNKSVNTGWLTRVSAQCPEDTEKGKQIQDRGDDGAFAALIGRRCGRARHRRFGDFWRRSRFGRRQARRRGCYERRRHGRP